MINPDDEGEGRLGRGDEGHQLYGIHSPPVETSSHVGAGDRVSTLLDGFSGLVESDDGDSFEWLVPRVLEVWGREVEGDLEPVAFSSGRYGDHRPNVDECHSDRLPIAHSIFGKQGVAGVPIRELLAVVDEEITILKSISTVVVHKYTKFFKTSRGIFVEEPDPTSLDIVTFQCGRVYTIVSNVGLTICRSVCSQLPPWKR